MPRTKKLANRRELITLAGRELFGRYSFAKTTMDDIAKHVGISKGLIYLEFPNKEAILFAIVMEVIAREQKRMEDQANNAKPPILHCLKAILLEHTLCIYDEATTLFHAPQLEMLTVDNWKEEIGHVHFVNNLIVRLLKEAHRHSEIPKKKDYLRIAHLLMATIATMRPPYPQYTTVTVHKVLPKATVEEDTSDLLDIFLAGLTVKKY